MAANTAVLDWAAAGAAAGAIAPPGPPLTRPEIEALVVDIRDAAVRAQGPVADTARMHVPGGQGVVLVVDRPGWARANARSFGALVDPVLEPALAKQASARAERTGSAPRSVPPAVAAVSRAVNAAETGALLAFLATKVLGQYDLFGPAGGRLLLVAPNIAHVESEIGAVPADFRLWVCLHEETHRVQFGANPWFAAWFTEQVRELVADLLEDPGASVERLLEGLGRLPELFRTPQAGEPPSMGLVDLIQTPEQREKLESLTAVMSLLEGHADVVMDEVGPLVVPTVNQIRARFDKRRQGLGPVDRVVRRLLGLEAKAAQYRDGAAFVRAVTAEVGTDGFNAVWSSPDTLPRRGELADASAWVARVHG